MTLVDLRRLLSICSPSSSRRDYRAAIVDGNVLLKATETGRAKAARFLTEFYALDPTTVVFRALRDLWDVDQRGQPLLALLCAAARDPTLRGTSQVILASRADDAVTPDMLALALEQRYPGRYRASIAAKIGRNSASTWQQSGHLSGKQRKVRCRAVATPGVAAYALLLGHLCGNRGDSMSSTLWAQLTDVPAHELHELVAEASKEGWLELRRSGGVVEVTFRHLLRREGSD